MSFSPLDLFANHWVQMRISKSLDKNNIQTKFCLHSTQGFSESQFHGNNWSSKVTNVLGFWDSLFTIFWLFISELFIRISPQSCISFFCRNSNWIFFICMVVFYFFLQKRAFIWNWICSIFCSVYSLFDFQLFFQIQKYFNQSKIQSSWNYNTHDFFLILHCFNVYIDALPRQML